MPAAQRQRRSDPLRLGASRGQLALATVLLAGFVAAAVLLPPLIAPGPDSDPGRPVAAPTIAAPGTSASPAPGASRGAGPTPAAGGTAPRASGTVRPGDPLLVDPPVTPRPVADPPRTQYHEFTSVCSPGAASTAPPVSGPGPAGTPYQLLGGCANPADRSVYWLPRLLGPGGAALTPTDVTVYYKAGVDDYTGVQPFPRGLRFTTTAATPPDALPDWSCPGAHGSTVPTSCPVGQTLTLRLRSPSCWDGRHLDVADHRGHLAWPVGGHCPVDHPVPVPMLLVRATYQLGVPAGSLRLSAPAAFGYRAGWDPAALAALVTGCVDAGRQCGNSA